MIDHKNKISENDLYQIVQATEEKLDEMEGLYNALHDHLQANINYPGWIKGVYPTRETAANGIKYNTLFVLKINNEIAGSIILNHRLETAYTQATWGIETDYDNIIVIHSLAVHPKYTKRGVGKLLMDFAKAYSLEQKMITIRLDVSIHNTPAIKLYEQCGYQFVGTVDLGLNIPNLVWFHLYEIIL
ncbi:MAG: acetyltransferase [Herbinix sp.]|jgi:ribosomal protein S18 acetylase RimI-like enzyme|nr:acetyltransferase [Herbinix sp.]